MSSSSTKENNIVNGVDVDALVATVGAIATDNKVGAFEFRSNTQWKQGAQVETTFTGHKQSGNDNTRDKPHILGGDEPTGLLGTGLHQGPTDSLLHAMSHCVTVTTVYHSAARGIQIDKLKVKASGHINLEGFLGLNDKRRAGFKQIHLQMYIDSPNPTSEVYDVFRFAQGHSPVCATVRNPVQFEFDYDVDVIEGEELYAADQDDRHGVSFKGVMDTVTAVKNDPEFIGKVKFFTETEWQGGAKVETTISKFEHPPGNYQVRDQPIKLVCDEPQVLLGQDAGPGPTETMLHGVANCISVGSSYFTCAQGIQLKQFSIELDGDVNLAGFADVNDYVTPGYTTIRAKMRARAAGCTKEQLLEFCKSLPKRSPICDSVANPVHVTFGLTHNGKEVSSLE